MDALENRTDAPLSPASRDRFAPAGWALTGGACAGGGWVLALVVGFTRLNVSLRPSDLTRLLAWSLVLGGAAVGIGLFTGLTVGVAWGGQQRFTFAALLGLLGVLFGGVGGGLSVPAVVAFGSWLHPVVSSALVWALAGALVGLIGRNWARWARWPEPPEEGAEDPAPQRIEWLLQQKERRISDWPLFRVLPVVVVSALVLVGAAAFPDKPTLAAVGVLGLAVALVLQVQEHRLRRLEARLRKLERRFRGAPDDETTT